MDLLRKLAIRKLHQMKTGDRGDDALNAFIADTDQRFWTSTRGRDTTFTQDTAECEWVIVDWSHIHSMMSECEAPTVTVDVTG